MQFTCSDNSLVGHSTTARGRLGFNIIPLNCSSRRSNYRYINKLTVSQQPQYMPTQVCLSWI